MHLFLLAVRCLNSSDNRSSPDVRVFVIMLRSVYGLLYEMYFVPFLHLQLRYLYLPTLSLYKTLLLRISDLSLEKKIYARENVKVLL